MSDDAQAMWDEEATTFDEAADHGLRDEETRAAWRRLLLEHLPPAPARVADLGCGTGTLSLLLAEDGYAVDAVDFSPEMVARARAKTAGVAGVTVTEADAGDPPLDAAAYDVVLCRHVLWALPEPADVLQRWLALLRPGGVLLLVEGHWGTGAGFTAAETTALVEGAGRTAELHRLEDPVLWGRAVSDERYLVVSPR